MTTLQKDNYELMRAGAMSFANITDHERNCYNYNYSGIKARQTPIHTRLHDSYLDQISKDDTLKTIKKKYHSIAILVALEEVHYPVTEFEFYAWSINKRATATFRCGQVIANTTFKRNNLNAIVEYVIDDIRKNSKIVTVEVRKNINDEN